MKRLFTFMGTGRYEEVLYVLDERVCRTPHFAIALREWFPFDEVVFFLTPEAKAHDNWQKTEATFLSRDWKFLPVDIPNGKSESELWEIFDCLTSLATQGDSVSFDITHAFRSIPLLSLLAAAFLRRAVGLDLEAIYYGAYEATKPDGETPVFELTPFLNLLEWLSSAEHFIQFGDSRALAAQLRKIQAAEVANGGFGTTKLNSISTALSSLSDALLVNSPPDVPHASRQLFDAIASDRAARVGGPARVFATLLDRVNSAYRPLSDPSLAGYVRIARWYFDNGHIVHASTLCRECLVSLLCDNLNLDPLKDKDRQRAEEALNHLVFEHEGNLHGEPSALLSPLKTLPCCEEFLRLWSQARPIRNNTAHCGFKENRIKPSRLKGKVESLLSGVEKLFSSRFPHIS